MPQYIVDTDVLIKFYCHLGRPDILQSVLGVVTIAERVRREFEYHGYGQGKEEFLQDLSTGRVRTVDAGPAEHNVIAEYETTFMHAGERDSAAIALTHLYTLITNDRRAREDLMEADLDVHDSRWILKEAHARRFITQREYKTLLTTNRR
jgi:predicted nucleic acid-binding protein